MSRPNLALARAMRQTGRPATRQSNAALLPSVQAGDANAVKLMVESNMPLVIKKAKAYLRCRPAAKHLADDMISAGFIALIESVNRLAKAEPVPNGNATGYISIAIDGAFRSIAVDSVVSGSARTEKRRFKRGEKVPHAVKVSEEMEPCSNPAALYELREEIAACCESDDDREILRMREAGFSDSEIAKALRISRTTVFNSRKAIEARYIERCDT